MNNNFSCGERLRELRVQANLSQEELAFRAGLSTAYIGMIERGVKNPTVRVLEQLCDGLEIGLNDFFVTTRINHTQEDALMEKIHRLPPKDREELLVIIEKIISFRK